MGHKAKKKNSSGSSSKSKTVDEGAPTVALPAVKDAGPTSPDMVKNSGAVNGGNEDASDQNLNLVNDDVQNGVNSIGMAGLAAAISSNPKVLNATQSPSALVMDSQGPIASIPSGKVTHLVSGVSVNLVLEDDAARLNEKHVTFEESTQLIPDNSGASSENAHPSPGNLNVGGAPALAASNGNAGDVVIGNVGKGTCVPINVDEVSAGGTNTVTEGGSTSLTTSNAALLPKPPIAAPNYSGYVGDGTGKANEGGKAPWLNLFGDNREITKGYKLQEDLSRVKPHGVSFKDMVIEEDDFGKLSLVGYFASRHPGREGVQRIVNSLPVKCKFFQHTSGWIVFNFGNELDRDKVLSGGPYYVYGKSLLLKKMPKWFHFSKKEFSIVPVWIQLQCLPLVLWKPEFLSSICTFLGTLLYTDHCTVSKDRISFSRCLVEVDVSRDLPSVIPIILPDGEVLHQTILYEDLPSFCSNCKMLGHSHEVCKGQGSTEPKLYVRRLPKGVGKGPINKPIDTSKQNTAGTIRPAASDALPAGNATEKRPKKEEIERSK